MTTTRAVDISIVIVSWNTRELLRRCLETIAENPPRATYEVIVIDNDSSDGSAEAVRADFPEFRLITNSHNIGFAAANNKAILASRGRMILLLNPDTEVRTGSLDTMLDFMERRPEAGAVGARLIHPDGTLQLSFHPAPTLAREMWRLFHLDRLRPISQYSADGWGYDAPRSVEVLQGACLLLRKQAFDQVGPLDQGYFMYSEEMDLCYRLRKAGWRLYWVPDAVVVHHGGQSSRQIPTEMFLHLYRSKILYFRKNHGRASALAYKVILALAASARLLITPLAWLAPRARRERNLMLAGRYLRLLATLPAV